MKTGKVAFVTLFAVGIVATACVHELGHAVAGWVQGVGVFPTPFKEYVLRGEVEWHQYTWIALGGVCGTVLTVMATLIWYMRSDRVRGDAILGGVLLTPIAYTIRFLLVGRGHDALEWQAAQAALGVSPSGHAVDVFLFALCIIGIVAWLVRRRAVVGVSLLCRVPGLLILGVALLVVFQVGNNALFDRFFARTRILNVPPELQADETAPRAAREH